MPKHKKKLDTVVKLGLGVLVGSFLLIWGGMLLTRPDRSIPPYSVGAQEGIAVAVHVPPWTSDPAIESLMYRFRKVGRETRNFGSMKIQPTTPGDPGGPYRRIVIYVFSHDTWTEPDTLHRYLSADRTVRLSFKQAVRGFYRLEESTEEGRIGPLLGGRESTATAAYARVLFRGPLSAGVEEAGSPTPSAPLVSQPGQPGYSPSPPPSARADRDH